MEKSQNTGWKNTWNVTSNGNTQPNESQKTECISDTFITNSVSEGKSSDEAVPVHSNNSMSDDQRENCVLTEKSSKSFLYDLEKIDMECMLDAPKNSTDNSIGSLLNSLINTVQEVEDMDAKVSDQQKLNMELKEVVISDPVVNVKKTKEAKLQTYRCESDSSSDDDSSSSSSFGLNSSSDCSDSFLDKMHKNAAPPNKVVNVKTEGELDLDELPPIQELKITILEKELHKCGTIYAIVDKLVVVRALKDLQPLDLDSVLFLSSEKPLGRIFDVFGPVVEPFYSIRFNSAEHIIDTGVSVDADVLYAPEKEEITSYVFVDELRQQKGSDASWKDNNEPPEEYLDYSDDEQEKAAKLKRRAKNRPINLPDDNLQIKKRGAVIPPFRKTPRRPHMDEKFPSRLNSSAESPVSRNSYSSSYSYISSNIGTSSHSKYPSLAATLSSRYPITPTFKAQNVFQVPPAIFTPPPMTYVTTQPAMSQQNIGMTAQLQRSMVSGSPLVFRTPQPIVLTQQQNMVTIPPPQQPNMIIPSQQQNVVSLPPQQTMVSNPSSSFSYFSQPYIPRQQLNSRPPHMLQQQSFVPPQRPNQIVPIQQSHIFGQMTPLGPMSPALQQPNHPFSPPVLAPQPALLAMSFPSPGQPSTYFPQNFSSAPSPPLSRQIANSNWQHGQSVGVTPTNSRGLPSMTPLSIQIPNLRSPPPPINVSVASVNGLPASYYTSQNHTGFAYQR